MAFGRAEPSLRSDLERHGVAAILGEGRVYASIHGALALVGGDRRPRENSG